MQNQTFNNMYFKHNILTINKFFWKNFIRETKSFKINSV